MNGPVQSLACDCEDLFVDVIAQRPSWPIISLITDYQQRFARWNSLLGVSKSSGQRLDNRLQQFPDMEDILCRLLDSLGRSLTLCLTWQEPREFPEYEEAIHESSHPSRLQDEKQALAEIEHTLERLDRLSVTIKQLSRMPVDDTTPISAQNQDSGSLEDLFTFSVKKLYPKTHQSLQKLLSASMSYRYIKLMSLGLQERHTPDLWSRTIKEDIRPYICLVAECPETISGYATFEDWLDHMQKHGVTWNQELYQLPTWICTICEEIDPPFEGPEKLSAHMKESHLNYLSDEQLDIIAYRSRIFKRRPPSECLLCGLTIQGDEPPTQVVSLERRNDHSELPEAKKAKISSPCDELSDQLETVSQPTCREALTQHIGSHLIELMGLTIHFVSTRQRDSSQFVGPRIKNDDAKMPVLSDKDYNLETCLETLASNSSMNTSLQDLLFATRLHDTSAPNSIVEGLLTAENHTTAQLKQAGDGSKFGKSIQAICLCTPTSKPSRPLNTFALYRKHYRAQVIMDNPKLLNKEILEFMDTTALKVIEICSTWKHAAREVGQRVLVVESCWDRTRLQVDFVSRIVKIMDDEQRLIMDRLLSELAQSLSLALSSLENVVNKEAKAQSGIFGLGYRVKRASWVWKKDALDEIVSDLEAWQRRFDPSWFLLMKIADPVIDSELKKAGAAGSQLQETGTTATNPLTLAAGLRTALTPAVDKLKTLSLPNSQMDWLRIPFSDAKAARTSSASNASWYIIDSIQVNGSRRVGDLARDVRVLAAKLSEADPLTFGLLNCKGYVTVQQQRPPTTPSHSLPGRINLAHVSESHRIEENYSQFRLVFRIPHGMEVLQSLRHLLLNSDAHISLSRKMSIAREVAKAVNYVHTFSFVHKNVRPESILCFEDSGASRNHAFLIGFDAFRATDGGTMMGGDIAWDRNVYRHPSRQGTNPAERYSMQHDIYSLGVCLLEIGLWESFVEYSTESELDGAPRAQSGKSYHDFQAWFRQRGGIAGPEVVAYGLKDYMTEQANTRLAYRMGDKYAHLTVSCLTCLDDDNENFLLSETDGDEQVVARQFIETVLKGLSDISV